MDDREEFVLERRRRLESLPSDDPVRVRASGFFEASLPIRYSYNFDWLGLPIIQYPQDLVALQEIIWKTKPDLIVETGIARGGSLIFYASMLKLLGNGGKVVGVDIDIRPHNRDAVESHPMSKDIVLIEGSSVDPKTVAQVKRHLPPSGRTMVILDSNHSKDHVARELELYSPFVHRGMYLVVFDTVVEYMSPAAVGDRPWGKGNSPLNAVEDFLRDSDRFDVDRAMDAKLLISVAPSGYLRCTKDP